MFKLVIQDDEGKTTVVPLIRDEITIGRKEGNTIRLTERNVSRRHARILRNNGEVQIEDLGSYNGIRVNNARIAERVSLRISDQVQIGDYKLYLKAEGVEQVDDARTMPIERIDNAPATEVMAAVQAPVAAPTAPMPAQQPPAPAAPAVAPPRTIPPTPEVDPGGRPVATAAQVAALTQPAAYGKLAIVSSNFAGKEFDLTRPQMIIGRTDENDIVIPHRSISRNHAKITRDPETQRYTIGDLQSSNGVRVNGQDYSKVELRRGDIVDLGHVRLRFIEPGEDFVFERDARIEDVEPPSGKRGVLVAAVLAVLVLGGVAAFLFVRSQHQPANGGVTGDRGSGADVATTGSASNPVATTTPIDAAGSAAVAMVGSNPGSDTQAGSDTAKSRKLAECHGLQADRKWNDLQRCADELRALDPADADTLAKQATAEAGAEKTSAALEQALGDKNLSRARKLLDKIQPDSVYREKAQNDYQAVEDTELTRQAQDLARAHKCSEIDTIAGRASSDDLARKLRAIPCETPVAVVPIDCSSSLKDPNDKRCLRQFCSGHSGDGRCPNAAQPACNPEPFTAEGRQKYETGDYHGAMASYDQALSCHYDANTNKLAFIAACNARDAAKAKGYYRRLASSEKHSSLLQSCVKQGITEDVLKQ